MIDHDALLEEAIEWAHQRAIEEGDVDIERDYPIIEEWIEDYITTAIKEYYAEY